jgi:type IV pilus assembly protein PilB
MPRQNNNQQTSGYSTTALVDQYLGKAIEMGASDIHIEPELDSVRIRLRIDGILREIERLPINILDNLVSRIKVLSNLDISETRKPQDGRFDIKKQQTIDLRVSIMPTSFGEAAVIRLLDQSKLILTFNELGLNETQKEIFYKMIKKPYGLVLVTGPTGSGKTTTLFSVLNNINSIEKCIVTLEDPVEYHLPLLRQTQINERSGFGFARGLRSLFRQNPDVIMVGEIRDRETADIVIQAAMTGHLVLSTLHTNDSVGALIRLKEMGLEKFLITSATSGIIAQRLVRKICPDCKVEYEPAPELLETLSLTNNTTTYYRGSGCTFCHASGFRGRTGVFEILEPNQEIKKLVYQDVGWRQLYDEATKQGMQTLRQSGLEKVKEGSTTLEEIIRVTSK